MPLPLLVVGGLTVWVVGLAAADAVLGRRRERRRKPRPTPRKPDASRAEIDAAIEQGGIVYVVTDVTPVPVPDREWYGRMVGDARHDGDAA